MDASGQLDLYNRALTEHIGDKKLASLSENRKARALLDDVWNRDPIKACLEAGQWTFGNKIVAMQPSETIEPAFGYENAFEKPDDWLVTTGIAADPYFGNVLDDYRDSSGIIYAPVPTVYLQYVSNDPNYGYDDSQWPEYFRAYVAAHLAARIVKPLTQSDQKAALIQDEMKRLLQNAQGKDDRNRPTTYPSQSNWTRARIGVWGIGRWWRNGYNG